MNPQNACSRSTLWTMFLGHYAVAFAAKRVAPRTSLGTLFFGAQFADLLWPNLVLAGVERFTIEPGITAATPLNFTHYPWSHSLIAMSLWALLVGAVYFAAKRYAAGALVLALCVVSHWFLDFASHRPDMPLLFNGPFVGLELWRSVPATIIVESLLFLCAVLLYVRTTAPRNRKGAIVLAVLIAFFAVSYLASAFGPPPPSVAAVAWSAELMWLFVLLGAWADRNRAVQLDVAERNHQLRTT